MSTCSERDEQEWLHAAGEEAMMELELDLQDELSGIVEQPSQNNLHVDGMASPITPPWSALDVNMSPVTPPLTQIAIMSPVTPSSTQMQDMRTQALQVDADGAPKRRRLRTKTPPHLGGFMQEADLQAALDTVLAEAIGAETADDELGFLAMGVKRQHVHWTHVHTNDATHVQPEAFTSRSFYAYLLKLYVEVYPDSSSPSGTILGFALIAEERHAKASMEAHRYKHHHAATFSRRQHYWNKIASLSLKKYRVPLNAVAHDSYATMYAYLRRPTTKKPLEELDAEPFFSPLHPRGQNLVELLRSSQKSMVLNASRHGDGHSKRPRAPSIYEIVKDKRIETVDALQALAEEEAQAGRPALAEYCTRQGHKLADLLESAWAVVRAPKRAAEQFQSLVDKLEHVAKNSPCVCEGVWIPGARKILEANRIPVHSFCSAMFSAVSQGAARSNNVACVGPGGCGKSTLLEPLDQIFNCAPKPEEGTTFAVASLAGYEVFLWQDYEHDEKTLRFTDLLSILVAEAMLSSIKVVNPSTCLHDFRMCD